MDRRAAEEPLPPLRLTFYINLVACLALAACVTAPQAVLRGARARRQGGAGAASAAESAGLAAANKVSRHLGWLPAFMLLQCIFRRTPVLQLALNKSRAHHYVRHVQCVHGISFKLS